MIIKCKMCGGDIEFTPGETYGTCAYCGSTSTIPKAEDEQKLNRYNRANHFRRQCEFDKALAAYEKLLEQDDTDAEAHWGAVISRYGIEYVEDPATGRRVPTCHRVQVASILADADYLAALENAPDAESRRLYEAQAAEIAEIQRGILAISANEKPYDVFICYKETDENGQRTWDSQWAQEVYYGLTEQGYKVFFSRITLEDKLGQQYEPYIFAALNSARVMVVIGSRPEHFGAVWVKNEWSRYLALMAKDRKRLLIPCYRGMDPYDLPEELSALQSQDMSKIGFMQDLLRGIRKVLDAEKKPEQPQVIVQQAAPVAAPAADANLTALLKRGNMALADGEWRNADEFFEKALNLDAEAAEAYMGKFLAREQSPGIEAWTDKYYQALEGGVQPQTLSAKQMDKETAHIEQTVQRCEMERYLSAEKIRALYQVKRTYSSTAAGWEKARQSAEQQLKDKNLVRALQFATGALKERYEAAVGDLTGKLDAQLAAARRRDETSICQIRAAAAETFAKADVQAEELHRAAAAQLAQDTEDKYVEACLRMETARQDDSASDYDTAATAFEELKAYKDSLEKAAVCRQAWVKLLKAERVAQEQREEAERVAHAQRVEAKRRKAAEAQAKKRRMQRMAAVLAIIAVAAFFVVTKVIIPGNHYKEAEALLAAGQYQQASEAFAKAGSYKDAAERVLETYYVQAEALLTAGEYDAASEAFTKAGSYRDAKERVGEPYYVQAEALLAAEQYQQASEAFTQAGSYKDAVQRSKETSYAAAEERMASGDEDGAVIQFAKAAGYRDALKQSYAIRYRGAEGSLAAGWRHTVGLKRDGTVVEVGNFKDGQYIVIDRRDIVAVSTGDGGHTVGLKQDGTVVAVGYNVDGQRDVSGWRDIVAVSAGNWHTVGLKRDGTVVAVGSDIFGQCDVSGWRDIVAVAAGNDHTVGLKRDGTVVAVGYNKYGQCDVSGWRDIVAIAAGDGHTVGLKRDGTVVAVGDNEHGECDVSGWRDIVAVAAGEDHTAGLKRDGTVVAVGDNKYGQCNVSGCTDIGGGLTLE